jgi:hypothetical protein
MDETVTQALVPLLEGQLPRLPKREFLEIVAALKVKPLAGAEVEVAFEDRTARASIPPISRLWSGNRQPPNFGRGEPPEDYLPFFLLLETTAARYAALRGRGETDDEYHRIYRQLRRRPDGTDANPVFAYLQAAARLYLAVHETSRAEFEGVLQRLERSTSSFRMHESSTNYYDNALAPLG